MKRECGARVVIAEFRRRQILPDKVIWVKDGTLDLWLVDGGFAVSLRIATVERRSDKLFTNTAMTHPDCGAEWVAEQIRKECGDIAELLSEL